MVVLAIPTAGDIFEYTIIRKVGSGSGEYTGYTDELKSNRKYEITYVGSKEVQFHAAFSPDTRRYTTKTDLDEYDKILSSGLSVWLWISPDMKLGDKVAILDD